ncbi:TonB C-terminal domain-containing protein [Labrys okinawensis]|uniref:TonB C-terminal domain-containing protein n=1 Tax=Labrys okinawensis TaxID=346911 RepID=UPI0039BD45B8
MTDPLSKGPRPGTSPGLPLLPLWAGAATLMLAAHGAAGWAIRGWQPGEPPMAVQEAEPVIIDLPPVAVVAEAAPAEAVPEVRAEAVPATPTGTAEPLPAQTAQAETVEPQITADTPIETAPPVEPGTAQAEPVQPELPPVQPEDVKPATLEPLPDVPTVSDNTQAEVVMPAAKPQKTQKRPITQRKVEKRDKADQPRPQQVRQVQQAAPAKPQKASASELAAWKGSVDARIRRATANRSGGLKGIAHVSIAISGSGEITSVSASSSNPAIASKAKSLMQAMGSLPPPPGGGSHVLNISLPFE